MPADQELNALLNRRLDRNEALEHGQTVATSYRVVNVYTEFSEFSRKQIKEYEKSFKKWVLALDTAQVLRATTENCF